MYILDYSGCTALHTVPCYGMIVRRVPCLIGYFVRQKILIESLNLHKPIRMYVKKIIIHFSRGGYLESTSPSSFHLVRAQRPSSASLALCRSSSNVTTPSTVRCWPARNCCAVLVGLHDYDRPSLNKEHQVQQKKARTQWGLIAVAASRSPKKALPAEVQRHVSAHYSRRGLCCWGAGTFTDRGGLEHRAPAVYSFV